MQVASPVTVARSIVTVVMPVRNGAPHLGAAIRSILSQTVPALTLLIIDDGSTDGSISIARSFADPRIRVVEDGMNRGLAARLNQGLDEAATQFVARMDADDLSLPNRLERQLALMQAYPEVGICGSWYGTFTPETYHGHAILPTDHFHMAARTVFDSPIGHPTVVFNMNHMDKHGLRYSQDVQHAEDYDLWERAHPLIRMRNVPEVLLHYRLHSTQVSSCQGTKQREASDGVRKRALERFNIRVTPEELALHCAYAAWDNLSVDERGRVLEWLREIRRRKWSWLASDRAMRRECRLREADLREGRR